MFAVSTLPDRAACANRDRWRFEMAATRGIVKCQNRVADTAIFRLPVCLCCIRMQPTGSTAVKAVNYLKRQSKPVLVTLAVVLVGLLGALDWLTGPEVSFSIFFLI